jgi:hypothetical protein
MNEVGFMNDRKGDYRLKDKCTFKNRGSDGKDPGPDMDILIKATRGVIEGRRELNK